MSNNHRKFYINGAWVEPIGKQSTDVVNPATEESIARVSLGAVGDVHRAVEAARAAFTTYSKTSKSERIEMLQAISAAYLKRIDEVAATVTAEMGAPLGFARSFHATAPIEDLAQAAAILKHYEFIRHSGTTAVVREPIGVCGLITPWNEPIGAIVWKAAPALAAGCTVVVKPSELAPLSGILLAEIIHEARLPRGVFNLVNGDGPVVGNAICTHPDVAMVAFTGSTGSGIKVAQASAGTVKRVQQELGGKSANIILPDADIETVAAAGLRRCYRGSGQSCQAPTRMLVHRSHHERAMASAKAAAESFIVGDPLDPATSLGPVANRSQYEKVETLISSGLHEGLTLVTGGLGRPTALHRGYFVQPTVFGNVKPQSAIAREEIFGPVLSIIPYESVDEAVAIANDSDYGLAGWVYSATIERAREVAMEMRTGRVYLNGAPNDPDAPFGGYKHSGNGREGGVYGFESYLEIKALLGARPATNGMGS
jgi:aldehyde dehydrogenase (NAD+)